MSFANFGVRMDIGNSTQHLGLTIITNAKVRPSDGKCTKNYMIAEPKLKGYGHLPASLDNQREKDFVQDLGDVPQPTKQQHVSR